MTVGRRVTHVAGAWRIFAAGTSPMEMKAFGGVQGGKTAPLCVDNQVMTTWLGHKCKRRRQS